MAGWRSDRDLLFYTLSAAIILVIGVTWYTARGMVLKSEGRDVQALLKKNNLASEEHYQQQAKNWTNRYVRTHTMTSEQRKQVEEIYTRAFRERSTIWIDGRLAGETGSATRVKQDQSWEKHGQEIEAVLAQK